MSTSQADRSAIRALHDPSPSTAAAHVALEWGLVVGIVALAGRVDHPAVTALAVVLIGTRQHAMAALVHEAAHRQLLPRRWNDLVGSALLAWPLLVSLRAYRRAHLAHHRHLGTDEDPDWARNRPERLEADPGLLARLAAFAGLGGGQGDLVMLFVGGGEAGAGDRAWGLARLATYAAVAAVVTALGAWPLVLVYWALPLFTWFLLVMRVRGISEHWAVAGRSVGGPTRTLLVSWLERLLFLPKNMGYHVEHHLHPGVPFHRLPELRRVLLEDPAFRAGAHATRGVLGLARELLRYPAR